MRALRRSNPTTVVMDRFGPHRAHAADFLATPADGGSIVPAISAVIAAAVIPVAIGLARNVAIAPGSGRKRTDARRRDARTTIEVDLIGRCGAVDDDAVPRMMILARHRGRA